MGQVVQGARLAWPAAALPARLPAVCMCVRACGERPVLCLHCSTHVCAGLSCNRAHAMLARPRCQPPADNYTSVARASLPASQPTRPAHNQCMHACTCTCRCSGSSRLRESALIGWTMQEGQCLKGVHHLLWRQRQIPLAHAHTPGHGPLSAFSATSAHLLNAAGLHRRTTRNQAESRIWAVAAQGAYQASQTFMHATAG